MKTFSNKAIEFKKYLLKPKHSKYFLLVLLLFILAIVLAVFKSIVTSRVTTEEIAEPFPVGYEVADKEKINCDDYSYEHEHNFTIAGKRTLRPDEVSTVSAFDSISFTKKLLQVDQIDSSANNSEFTKIAYILDSNYYSRFDKDKVGKVYISSYPFEQKELIYSLPLTVYENHEYTRGLRDVGFSDDGSLLAITTSDSLLLYNTATKNMRTLFTKPYDLTERTVAGVYAYHDPKFSPDNSKILVYKGFYEGRGALVYDRNSGEVIDTPYMYYGSGQNVAGWYKDKLVLYKKDFTNDGRDNEMRSISLVTLPDLKEELISESGGFGNISLIKNGKYYFVSDTREATNEYVCNSQGNLINLSKNIQTLRSLDLETSELKDLLTVDATSAWGQVSILAVSVSDSGNIYVKLDHDNSRSVNYELDEQKPGTLTELVIN